MVYFVILACLVAAILVWVVFIHNRLVAMRQQVKNAWHQIDVQLKRRHDLIPNMVSTVKAYLQHEQTTLELVTAARGKAMAAKSVQDSATAEAGLTDALGKLMAVLESYPDLKGNQPIRDLMEELRSTENRIGFARQQYNDSVMQYNTAIQVFPDKLVASKFEFKGFDFFEVDAGDASVPEVKA
ncbi:MAG TPA: LemA family protein [Myxococcota bacterium]|nr:LemA family protein [Myxococcota bacterium]HON25875.1 LemA family protein [Myxococcota bacterium]HOS60860.1 LemA family protein [Myxococcota bacterium]HPC93066.1 LemA family protein [Myxococcota bacterium]HPL26236.1 LemA family protein [Myxococcota bacterium]